jgi:hypothetical protein
MSNPSLTRDAGPIQVCAPVEAEIVNWVARSGVVLSAADNILTMREGNSGYQFAIAQDNPMAPDVLWFGIASRVPVDGVNGGRTSECRIGDFRSLTRPVLVDPDTAAWVVAAYDRHGQCRWCAGYGHDRCTGRLGDGSCACVCQAAWRPAAPTARGCRIAPATTGWFATKPLPSTAPSPASDAAPGSRGYEAMGRWELVDGIHLAVGDRVCLAEAAIRAVIAVDPGTVDWPRLPEQALTVATISDGRRVGRVITLAGQVGAVGGVDVALRLKPSTTA